jgi:NAD(P)-dependent dehydrogenase (short-subunit alcohol dehydrogenase family)
MTAAFVTGAGGGIGRAVALRFARSGSAVTVVDIDPAGGEETAALVLAAGGRAIFVQADVASSEDIAGAVQATVAEFGSLDFAHNNAGITGDRTLVHETSRADWQRILDVNLTGIWNCMRHQIPVMLAAGGGAIVNTSSAAGLTGTPELSAYAASKFGVIGLTRSAAVEYAADGIRVNAVCPGLVWTPMLAAFTEAHPDWLTGTHLPQGRMADPDDIAAAVFWLCSADAGHVNGVALPVDGGVLAGGSRPSSRGSRPSPAPSGQG